MMQGLVLGLLALAATVTASSYTIVVPKRIVPGLQLPLTFTFNNTKGKDVNVQVDLIKNEHKRLVSLIHTFKRGEAGTVYMRVPADLDYQYQYKLIVHGLSGVYFIQEVHLQYDSGKVEEKFDIFTQTDKAIYKPGQTVRFRTFGLFSNMSVFTGALNVSIMDPNSNKIKQWINVSSSEYGVVENFMLVDTEPIVGKWKIVVATNRVDGKMVQHEKSFTIQQYVLPKFDVSVDMPPYVLTTDKDLTITVKAKYTYGKPVEGTVLVKADLDYPNKPWRHNSSVVMVETTVNIDGEVDVSIPLTKIATEADPFSYEPLINKLSGYHVTIDAMVTESINNLTHDVTGKTQFFSKPYNVELDTSQQYFKAGLPFTTFATVTQADGRPILSTTKDVTLITYTKFYDKFVGKYRAQTLPERTFNAPPSGKLLIEVDTPSNAQSLHLEIHYKGLESTSVIRYYQKPKWGDMQISMKSQGAAVGQEVVFNILSLEPMVDMHYLVLTNGRAVTAGDVVSNNQSSIDLRFTVTNLMEPYAHLIVYTFNGTQYNADSIYFNINDNSAIFKNKVSMSFNASIEKPGNTINLDIHTDPASLVNILAVDQSVLLLATGNDITQADVVSSLKSDSAPSSPSFYSTHSRDGILRNTDGMLVITDVYGSIGHSKRQLTPQDCMGMPSGGQTFAPYVPGMVPTPEPGRTYAPNKIPTPAPGQTYAPGQYPTYVPGMVPTPAPGYTYAPGTHVPAGAHLQQITKTRSNFPETFLWTNVTANADGNATLTVQVPDTITSWVAGGFSVNKQSGLGIVDTPATFKSFRPFFVSLNLPYFVVRGEELVLQANVFNYQQQDMQVLVTLDQSADFKVIQNNSGMITFLSQKVTRNISVSAGTAKAVYIPILPEVIGSIPIVVKAQSILAADAVRRQILVKPEGVQMEYNVPTILAAGDNISVPIATPPMFVPDSLMVTVSVTGDVMGPAVRNMNNLLRLPTGCGEQTMASMAPDIYITRYLESTNQITPDIRTMATSYMERGYQRELTFQGYDGSFSIWGGTGYQGYGQGSTWLTSFVAKTFHQAQSYIFISDDVIVKSLEFIRRNQNSDGSVKVIGHVHDVMLQGGARTEHSLTAFALIAFVENQNVGDKYSIQNRQLAAAKMRAFLEGRLHQMTTAYELAITSYALSRAGSNQAAISYSKLENIFKVEKDDKKHWTSMSAVPKPLNSWDSYYQQAPPVDIETAAYGLLYLTDQKLYTEGLPVLKWLLSKRNAEGGFSSTQDTVMGLQAISEYQSSLTGTLDMNVVATVSKSFTHMFNINSKDASVYKTTRVPRVVLSQISANQSTSSNVLVQMTSSGQGSALAEVGVSLYVEQEVLTPSFNISTHIETETLRSLTVAVDIGTISPTLVSGMSVVEVGIPTGFVFEMVESRKGSSQMYQKYETKDGKVVLYYDRLTYVKALVRVKVIRTELVAKTKPAAIKAFEYYQPENRGLTFYESTLLKYSSFCDICADCGC